MKTNSTIGYFNSQSQIYDAIRQQNGYTAPEIIWELLGKHTTIYPKELLLDIGIGTGLSSIYAKEKGLTIVGIDGSQKMLHECEKKEITKFLFKKDFIEDENWYLCSDYFNYAISSCVFYFIEDLINIFIQTHKLLIPGGYFVFNTKSSISKELLWKEFGRKNKIKIYTHPYEYIYNLIEQNGFELIESRKDFTEFSILEKKSPMIETFIARKK
jgi:predicted TPR repeat methyltransferase